MKFRLRLGVLGICLVFVAMGFTVRAWSFPQTKQTSRAQGKDLAVHWTLIKNADDGRSHWARWTITNHSQAAFPATGWTLYFSQMHLSAPKPILEIDPAVNISHFSGDLIKLQPTASFAPIAPGKSFSFEYHGVYPINKECFAPAGLYIVFETPNGDEEKPEVIGKVTSAPFTTPEQIHRGTVDKSPIPTPSYLHAQNAKLSLLSADQISPITPTPVAYRASGKSVKLANTMVVRHASGLERDAAYLAEKLQRVFGAAPKTELGTNASAGTIVLKTSDVDVAGQKKTSGSEAYTLDISPTEGITITGADAAGVFYGIQSFLQLLPPNSFAGGKNSEVAVPVAHVEDAPRFAYRGQHFDVSHNFHQKASILKLLDVMAFYKLNTFHFQVSDDEGWRIEIPELPELTQISGFRAHTRDHDGVLQPSYGTGPFRDPDSYGQGFYTRQDYIDILKYARDRHIRVIPEINLPAHARGALIALKAREKRLLAEGKTQEALKYRLYDPDDTSKYFSAQGFLDNAVCVVDEPVYQFAEMIIRNFEEMFAAAEMPLETWHFGADEVPHGVWTGSPRCQQFLKAHPEWQGPDGLKNYFVGRILAILDRHKMQAACWQEAALNHVQEGKDVRDNPIPEFAGGKLIPYVWNNTKGNEDLCNRFANLGYPVVMCSVSNLYFDLAYNNDPVEPGHNWAGFIDARSPFEFVPEDVFKSTRVDAIGEAYDRQAMYAERQPLTETGLKNILGIQGQIWCETIKGPKMLDYAVYPKILGLAERAWSAQPAWAKLNDLAQHDAAVQSAWNEFANRLGQRELPRMDALFRDVGYRLPPPGAVIKNGMLQANIEYPGLVIRYDIEGKDPTVASPVYQGPVSVKGSVKLSTFDTNGRSSRAITVP